MFDAYKVAIKLTLVSNAAQELRGISAMFKVAGKEVDTVKLKIKELETQLKSLKRVAAASMVGIGAGFVGLKAVKSSLGPGLEYAHQLNILAMHGMKQQEIAETVATAWKITGEVLTTTATQNLKTILDLKNVFGLKHEAIAYAPSIAKLGAVLAAAGEGKLGDTGKIAEDIGFAVSKALDIRNAVGNAKEFDIEATAMGKVGVAFQQRITPEDYRMLFKYANQAIPGLSNEFLYEQLPTFMLEMKGQKGSGGQGGFGTSLAAFYRFWVQGVMSKTSMAHLQDLTLLPKNAGVRTATTGTMLKKGFHVKDVELAQSNQLEYTQKVLLPEIFKKYGYVDNKKLALIIGDVMKGASQKAIFATQQYALKSANAYRDQKIVQGAMNSEDAYKQAISSDPYTAIGAFHAQMTNLKTAFTMGVIPFIVPAIISLTKELNKFAEWAREHPNAAKNITIGLTAVSAALVVFGTVIGVRTAFAIMGAKRALDALNMTLMRTAGAAEVAAGGTAAGEGYMSGKGYGRAARAGGGRFFSALGGGLAGVAGFSLLDSLYAEFKDPRKYSSPADDEMGKLKNGVVNLYIDGKQVASTLWNHLGDMLHMSQWSTQSQFNMSAGPTVAGATAPR